ncbi:MAG TPA: hypothetical protein VGC77_11045 [Rhodopseudomonas sp.]|uniref:hypothetical protein n=1 Tax=Rhodopseudomonas sp. TaxID=1078 RepID=UPI002EDA5A9F
MKRKDPLTVLRDHVIATDDQTGSPGMKAVDIERALERAGFAIMSNEAAALLAFIVSRRGINEPVLDQVLIDLGLAHIVPYDPAQHTGGSDQMLPGDSYLKYSDALSAVLEHGRVHISAASGKLQ